MKRILCVSDTHGNVKALKKLDSVMESVDYIFHLGDHWYDIKPFLDKYESKVYSVFGNCDGGGEDYEMNIDGVKVLLTHGDAYKVKYSLLRLSLRAQELSLNLVCFGHTHSPIVETENGITFVNPGCMTALSEKTYAIIEIDNGLINATIKSLKDIENENI